MQQGRILLLAAVLSLGMAGCDRGSTENPKPVAGATGRAGDAAAQPGAGLQGGLGANKMGAGPATGASGASVAGGSKNRTTGGSVGNR